MDTIFSFLARKTDFYINGKEFAEKIVLSTFKKYEKIAMEEKLKKQQERERQEKQWREKKKNEAMHNGSSKITELTDEEAEKLEKKIKMKKNENTEQTKMDTTGDAKENEDEEVMLFY